MTMTCMRTSLVSSTFMVSFMVSRSLVPFNNMGSSYSWMAVTQVAMMRCCHMGPVCVGADIVGVLS